MKSRVLMLVLIGLCFLVSPSSTNAQCGFTRSYNSYQSYSYKPYYPQTYYYTPPNYYYSPYYYGSTSPADQAQLITASVTLELKKDADQREIKAKQAEQDKKIEEQNRLLEDLGIKPDRGLRRSPKPVDPEPPVKQPVPQPPPAPKQQSKIKSTPVDSEWQKAVTATCIKCHGGPVSLAKGGGFDLSDLSSISYEDRLDCYQMMSRREMPKDKPLTEAQVNYLTLASDWAAAARQFRQPRQVANKE